MRQTKWIGLCVLVLLVATLSAQACLRQSPSRIVSDNPLIQVFNDYAESVGVGVVTSASVVKENGIRTVVNINVEASVKGTLGSSVTAWYPGGECEDGSSTFFYNFVDLPTSVRPMAVIVLKPGMRVMFFIREGRITAAINDPTPVGESAQGEKP